jgi:hypothetical protein
MRISSSIALIRVSTASGVIGLECEVGAVKNIAERAGIEAKAIGIEAGVLVRFKMNGTAVLDFALIV